MWWQSMRRMANRSATERRSSFKMITLTSKVLPVLLWLVSLATASLADSAKDLLAAGRVDEVIAELSGRLSSAPSDAESSNLLCRADYTLEEWDRAETACRKAV